MCIDIVGKKILLIGNGFDLAHGLPTSYKDFLDFCKMVRELYTYPIIDNEYNQKKLIDWNTDKTIKSKLLECYENRKNCFEDKITTQCKELDELYDCIKENVWINYFLEREKSIGENWIDFESEISNVVQAIETLKGYIERDEDVLKIKDTKQQIIIYFLKIAKKSLQDVFNLKRIDGFIEDISIELDKLIRSLEIYICEFVNEIDINKENDDIKTITPDYVLSFNYSNTYERIYGQSKKVTYDYIHGKADIKNNVDTCNLVLGIDEYLEDDKNDKLEFIKNPVIAEFLSLPNDISFTETELETSIITNLQKFLMELGKGYAFVSRQQHIHTEKQDYYIDLVFYNYYLKCFVLIDLKTEKISHQDVGQMDMYVRMYDELKRTEGDNPTIGIILCADTDEDIARYSILKGNEQLFASKYKLYLPTEEELRNEIETQKTIFQLQQNSEDLENNDR